MLSQINNRSAVQSTNQEQTSIANVYGNKAVAVDAKRINELWVRYARSIESTDTHLYTIMQQPPVINNEQIVINVNTDLQAAKISESADLINFLRQESGVPNLVLVANVDNAQGSDSSQFSVVNSREKLNEMIEINKDIETLIKEFNFDLDI